MAKLSEGIKSQIREMSADGKSAGEIKEFIQKTYNVDAGISTIYYICKKVKKSKRGRSRGGWKKKELLSVETTEISIEGVFQDILKLIPEIQDGCKKILLTIRKELIKSRAQVYELQKISQSDTEKSAEE